MRRVTHILTAVSAGCALIAIPLLSVPALPALALPLAGAALVCAWVALWQEKIFPAAPDVFVGGVALTALIATLITIAPDLSRNRFLSLLGGIVAYYAVLALAKTRRDVTRASMGIALIAGGIAFVGFFIADWTQAVIFPITRPFYDALPHFSLAVPGSGVPRVSEFASPRLIGGFLAVLLPVCAAAAFDGRKKRGFFVALAAGVTLVMLLTQTILAWGAAALALAVFVALARRSRRVTRRAGMALAAGAAAISLIALLPGARALGDAAIDLSNRVFAHTDMLRLAAQITRDAPIISNGLNTFPVVVTCFYPHPAGRDISFYPHAHNAFAQAAVDGGLIGMACAIGLVVCMAALPLAAARREPDAAWRVTLAGLGCAVIAYIGFNIFDGLVLGNKLIAVVWAVFALGQRGATLAGDGATRPSGRFTRWLAILFLAGALALLAYAALSGALAQNMALVQCRASGVCACN
ncbi:MAG TPA: O-antigen ligase family protein [Thermoflexales bacterium]|nr:O-antigen ligase family protein [Thermoflexales bacterium]